MKVLILAGGLGTRLRSVVNDRPKPMALVGEKPFLYFQLQLLREQGFKEIVLCVGYQHELIKEYFGDGQLFGVDIQYSLETEPLGTAGAIKNAAPFIFGDFMVINGDTLFKPDFNEILTFHQKHSGLATIALKRVEDVSRYGRVTMEENKRIIAFNEKDAIDRQAGLINAGCYIFKHCLLDFIPDGRNVSLEKEIFPQIIEQYEIYGFPIATEFFIDIGTPESYMKIQADILEWGK